MIDPLVDEEPGGWPLFKPGGLEAGTPDHLGHGRGDLGELRRRELQPLGELSRGLPGGDDVGIGADEDADLVLPAAPPARQRLAEPGAQLAFQQVAARVLNAGAFVARDVPIRLSLDGAGRVRQDGAAGRQASGGFETAPVRGRFSSDSRGGSGGRGALPNVVDNAVPGGTFG